MAVRIICDVIMFLNCIFATTFLFFEIFCFSKKCKKISSSCGVKDGSNDKYKLYTFQKQMFYIGLKQLLPAAIAIITCVFDGVTGILPGDGDQPYIPIAVGLFCGLFTFLFFSLTIFFRIMKDKFEFNYQHPWRYTTDGVISAATFNALVYTIIPTLSVYTIVLLCAL